MLADESILDDDYAPQDTNRDDVNDTYANFDSEGDQSEDESPEKPKPITENDKKKKTLTSKLFKGANKFKNKFM